MTYASKAVYLVTTYTVHRKYVHCTVLDFCYEIRQVNRTN